MQEWWHGRIRYEWRFWIPLVVLTVTNSCYISSKSPSSRLPAVIEVGALEPHPPALGPTDHYLECSTELSCTIINENTLLAQKWLSAKVAPRSQRCTCESKSVLFMNMLTACTWIYFCYFCHLFELIHFTWSIHCITLYYDFTYTHVAFNTCSNSYIFVTSNV